MTHEAIVNNQNCLIIVNKHPLTTNDELNNNQIEKEVLQLNSNSLAINASKKRFPYCVVWTHLPLISVFIPFVGHTGICTSKGIIHEFAGHQLINTNHLSFGSVIKYVQCKLTLSEQKDWDQLIEESDSHFGKTAHHLLLYHTLLIDYLLYSNNCHHHVGYVLERIAYQNKKKYTTCGIIFLFCLKGVYLSKLGIFKTYIGIFIIVLIIILIIVLCLTL